MDFEISFQYEHQKEMQIEVGVITSCELVFANFDMIFMLGWFWDDI